MRNFYYILNPYDQIIEIFDYLSNAREFIKQYPTCTILKGRRIK